MGKVPYCSLINYLKKENKPLLELFEEGCLEGLLYGKKGFGVTLLVPEKKIVSDLYKKLEKGDRPEVESIIKCLVLRDGYSPNQMKDAVNSHFEKVSYESSNGDTVKFTGGVVATLDKKFVTSKDRTNLYVYHAKDADKIKSSGEKTQLSEPVSKSKKGGGEVKEYKNLFRGLDNVGSIVDLRKECKKRVDAWVKDDLTKIEESKYDYDPIATYIIFIGDNYDNNSAGEGLPEKNVKGGDDMEILNNLDKEIKEVYNVGAENIIEKVKECYKNDIKRLCEDEVRYRVSLYVKKNFKKESVKDFFISCRRSIDNESPTICKNNNILRNTDAMRFHTIMAFVCSPYFKYVKISKELNDKWSPNTQYKSELYTVCRPKVPEELYAISGGDAEVDLTGVINYLGRMYDYLSEGEKNALTNLMKKTHHTTGGGDKEIKSLAPYVTELMNNVRILEEKLGKENERPELLPGPYALADNITIMIEWKNNLEKMLSH